MNLLAPLVFEDGEIDTFLRDNACALCLGHLEKQPTKDRRWLATCPHCGPVLKHSHTTKAAAVEHINGCRVAMMELAPHTNQTEAELLHDLGY